MTILTLLRERTVPDGGQISDLFGLMTTNTGDFLMSSYQSIAAVDIMIEIQLMPVTFVVTGRAIFDRITAGELPRVSILMTGETGAVFHSKIPIFRSVIAYGPFMTGHARLRYVRTDQFEFSLVMIGHLENGRHEPLFVMTAIARPFIITFDKLPPMNIRMTVKALPMGQPTGQSPPLVAFLAWYFLVQAN
jgi:hypothetical protein